MGELEGTGFIYLLYIKFFIKNFIAYYFFMIRFH